jgi:hypothetical protein
MKGRPIGQQIDYEEREEGIWAKAQLDLAAKYRKTLDQMIARGDLRFSSGGVDHLATKAKDGHIKTWPWVELSVTPMAAHPGAAVYAVKSTDALEHITSIGSDVPASLVVAAFKAFDALEDPGSGSFDDQGTRVVSEVGQYLERARNRYEQRATKVGREFSSTNRQWLQSLDERLASLAELRAEVQELLKRTDPETSKRVDPAVWEALAEQARFLGVTPS